MSARRSFTSSLGPLLARYLRLNEALGRKYALERDVFVHLDRFLAAQPPDKSDLTAETFALWCATLAHVKPGVRRHRMRTVRRLCRYRQRSEPSCFVPDPHTFPRPYAPRPPHFFTEQEILRILRATDHLRSSPTSPLRREGYRLAVVLLHTTGLRRGELMRLTLDDYDPGERTLHIRVTKFHKSRIVPLSRDAAREMDAYLRARRRLPCSPGAPLLCFRRRGIQPYAGDGLGAGLQQLFQAAGVRTAAGRVPRVHDLRHSFALNALLRWYRAGTDVQARLPALAVYMGHVSIVSTQYYLAFLEPFAEAVSERFADHCRSFLGGRPADGGVR
ncbi:MAG: tyrosine-type recombinase/integrase [Planctomycetota bacterium]|jgi:integrase